MSDASRAQALIEDPLLKQAFADIRAAAIASWEQTARDEADKRETAWLTVKVIDRIETQLQAVIDDGKVAAARIQAPLR